MKRTSATLSPAVVVGTAVGCVHALLLLTIQLENYFLHLYQPSDGYVGAIKFLALLPFCQLEHIVVSIAIGLTAWAAYRLDFTRWLCFSAVILLNLYLAVDQIIFPTFFDHLQLSMSEGQMADLSALSDSVRAEIRPEFYINLALIGLTGVAVFAVFLQPHRIRPFCNRLYGRWRESRPLVNLLTAFVVVSIICARFVDNHKLEHHALTVLARSAFAGGPPPAPPKPSGEQADIYTLRHGRPIDVPGRSKRKAELLKQIQARETPPNIVFIVLESVGTDQLFRNGEIDAAFTPNLAAVTDHMAVFDAVYTTFPATIRTHVPMNTGGRTITWGSVFEEFSAAYQGPVLVNELKQQGYRTALFSAGDFTTENMTGFFGQLDYDHVFEPGAADEDFVDAHKIHSWGVNEDIVREMAFDWVDEDLAAAPFFLHFLTISTHHPYGVVDGYNSPLDGDDRETRYYNSLHYNDSVIGRLLNDLRARKLLDNTVIVLTGDHGQAFGRRHHTNFTHKNYIYEENVRTFCIVLDFVAIQEYYRDHTVAQIGDIMPTVLALAGTTPSQPVPGRNLLDPEYTSRIVYFHKNAEPELWGLRDGNWKFITEKVDKANPELYDLDADPTEQHNLAAERPEQVALYNDLCGQWYVRTNDDFTSRLTDFTVTGGRSLDVDDLSSYGPKVVTFGFRDDDIDEFVELPVIHPYENMAAWTRWVSYPEDHVITYRWWSPSGDQREFTFKVRSEWSTTWVYHHPYWPMEEGTWRLALYDEQNRKLITSEFEVNADAELKAPLQSVLPSLRKLETGMRNKDLVRANKFAPSTIFTVEDTVSIRSSWGGKKIKKKYRILHEWHDPTGAVTKQLEKINGVTEVIDGQHPQPLMPGAWRVVMKTPDGRPLGDAEFDVVETAEEKAALLAAKAANPNHVTISLVHFNDLHAHYYPQRYGDISISPLSLIRGHYNAVKAQNPNTLFCSAGDEMEKGSVVEVISGGASTIDIYKLLGLDFRALGNHDFAYSLDQVIRFIDEPGDAALCANQSIGHDFRKIEIDGVRIGAFSMVCRPFDERDRQYTGPYYPEIESRYDFVKLARDQVARRRKEVDILIFLSHLGINDDRRIGNEVEGIDCIIGGHSHILLEEAEIGDTGAMIVHAGAWGEYVGRLDLIWDRDKQKINGYDYTVTRVDPANMTPDVKLERGIHDVLRRYEPRVNEPVCWSDRRLSETDIAEIAAAAAQDTLDVDAVIIDTKTVWNGLGIGPHNRQALLDCFKVEIQRCGTTGFNSMYTAIITGADLAILLQQSGERFVVRTPETIDPKRSYRLAIQKRTAYRINGFFPKLSEPGDLTFVSEMWELMTTYGLKRLEAGMPLH